MTNLYINLVINIIILTCYINKCYFYGIGKLLSLYTIKDNYSFFLVLLSLIYQF